MAPQAWALELWAVAHHRLVQPLRAPSSPVTRWLCPPLLPSLWGTQMLNTTSGLPVMVTPHQPSRGRISTNLLFWEKP